MSYRELQERVCGANKEIARVQLAILTWGNASEVDRAAGVFAIKPSGVGYEALTPADIPVISLKTGETIAGAMNPSSDTATHRHLYAAFPEIGGIVHTHSPYATAWAQARRPIPCLGTTHADAFYGSVPCTRPLTNAEVEADYERNTGTLIAAHFAHNDLSPVALPGVLVAGHGPFTWGPDAMHAVVTGRTLEAIAQMAVTTRSINSDAPRLESYLLDKHFQRKHGATAYYGQDVKSD